MGACFRKTVDAILSLYKSEEHGLVLAASKGIDALMF
jgi:hypothetical protein